MYLSLFKEEEKEEMFEAREPWEMDLWRDDWLWDLWETDRVGEAVPVPVPVPGLGGGPRARAWARDFFMVMVLDEVVEWSLLTDLFRFILDFRSPGAILDEGRDGAGRGTSAGGASLVLGGARFSQMVLVLGVLGCLSPCTLRNACIQKIRALNLWQTNDTGGIEVWRK